MAEVIKLLIDNPKIKRTTLAKASLSTTVLEKGELLAVFSGSTFTLRMGDGITEVRYLKDLAGKEESGTLLSPILTGTSAADKRDIYQKVSTSEATVELDSQKFTYITAGTTLTIKYKDPISGTLTDEPYHAEINCPADTTITFPTSATENYYVRCNDSEVIINNNIVTVTGPKKLQLRYQNKITELINAEIQAVLPNVDLVLSDLITKNETGTVITLDSANYTKITGDNDITINLLNATDKTKIFKGTIKFDSGSYDIDFPLNTIIKTNDSDFIINGNKITINKEDELLFTIYDNYCEIFNPNFNHTVPTKVSQVDNDEKFIVAKDNLRTKNETTTLYCDTRNVLEINEDKELSLSTTFLDGTNIDTDRVPEYRANIILMRDKTITLPAGTIIKSNDEENIVITDNKIKANKKVNLELNIRNGLCFAFVWGIVYWWSDSEIAKLTTADIGKLEEVEINGVTHHVRLIGVDHDNLADGSGKAHTTWQLEECLSDNTSAAITQKWNASYKSPYYNIWNDGTQSCDIRNYLRGTFKGMLPAGLQSKIKNVLKKTSAGNKSTTVNELEEDIFLLSLHEMASETGISNSSATYIKNYASTLNQEGTPYKYYNDVLGDIDPRSWNTTPYSNVTIKKDLAGTAKIWWMRSPSLGINIRAFLVSSSGYVYDSIVGSTYGVAPAFCI